MRYFSTRGTGPVGFRQAFASGLAPDGGLYLPEHLPDISGRLGDWRGLSYPQLAREFLGLFADELGEEVLSQTVAETFQHFTHPEIAPVVRLAEKVAVLELFHGPTLAFKDFALQWVGPLYEAQIRADGRPITVLGATSGDTGAAAIHGLLGRVGVRIFILYPDGRVSPLQERQMTCTGASNVFPLAIPGSFDDAQRAVKELFMELSFREEVGLSAINSINIARVLAQCVYYIYAVLRFAEAEWPRLRFVVPTGNFGNVLAGWMAARMGLPVAGFRVATNQNDILHRFFQTGEYAAGSVLPSLAPSMDIQVASNFERFLFYLLDGDTGEVRQAMESFNRQGRVSLPIPAAQGLTSSAATDREIPHLIQQVWQQYGYMADPHTACGFQEIFSTENDEISVVLATAHPAKFPDTIRHALGRDVRHSTLDSLQQKPIIKFPVKGNASDIKAFIEQHLPNH